MTNRYPVMEVFLEPALLFSGQNEYANIRRCSTISRHETRVSSLNTVSSKMAIKL